MKYLVIIAALIDIVRGCIFIYVLSIFIDIYDAKMIIMIINLILCYLFFLYIIISLYRKSNIVLSIVSIITKWENSIVINVENETKM